MTQRRFVLLDRDGTINVEREYLADPDGLELIPGASEGLLRMRKAGLGLVIVSNQSGIARGYFTPEQAEAVNDRLIALLGSNGIGIDGVYICPHAPDADCDCRKPALGMVHAAARDLGFDPAEGFMIGDKAIDMEMGRKAGATTIMVATGYGAEQAADAAADTDYFVPTLREAADVIDRLTARVE